MSLSAHIDLLYGSPLSVLSDCLRGFLVPAKGHEFVGADFNAIEARVVAWLANEEPVLQVFRTHGKIYEAAAAGIYSVPIDAISKRDIRRDVGKVAILALGFQGGVGALQKMGKSLGVTFAPVFESLWMKADEYTQELVTKAYIQNRKDYDISREEYIASDLVKIFWRRANPNIVNYWDYLDTAAKTAIRLPGTVVCVGPKDHRQIRYQVRGSFLACRLPSGGKIYYPYPRLEMRRTKWGEMRETIVYKAEDSLTRKFEDTTAYGGLLTENVVQAVARDLLAEALVRLEKAGFPIVLHVHDEAVAEVPTGARSPEEFGSIMAELPVWAKDLPVTAEGWRGIRFQK